MKLLLWDALMHVIPRRVRVLSTDKETQGKRRKQQEWQNKRELTITWGFFQCMEEPSQNGQRKRREDSYYGKL